MSKPRILFCNPPYVNGTIFMKEMGRCGRRSIGGELWPQTGLGYLASTAREAGAEVRVFDSMALEWTWEKTLDEFEAFHPDILVLLSTTPTIANDTAFAQNVRDRIPKPVILWAGTHVTALPRESLENSCAEGAILGEGESVIRRLITEWDGTLRPGKGLAVKSGGEIIISPERDTIENLDDLPDPARDLLPTRQYTMPFTEGRPFATIIPSRGCPYPCTFCRAGDVWGRKVRTRSPERIVSEILDLRDRWGVKDITFMTDTLLTQRTWAESVFDAMIEADLGIEWIGNARVDEVRPHLLEKMKKSGCRLMSFGIESGNADVLAGTKKGITLQQSLDGIRAVREAGITAFAYFILGMPGETQETIQESIDFAKTLDADYVNFHIATPFPGTEFYEQAKANGWITTYNWEEYEEEGSAVISYPHLSAQDLIQAQKRAMRSLYATPSRMAKELLKIRSTKDFVAKAKAGLRMLRLLGA